MADCGPSDRLTLTVAPLAGPPAGQSWRFHYAAGGQPIAVRNVSSAGNALAYLFSDHLGSTSVAADPTGTLVARQSYYPYGRVRTSSGTLPTERTFTGQVSDVDSTGLLFFNARYYDGALGRFISADSIVPQPGNPQSLNRYAYTRNNPIKYTDPSGHIEADCGTYGESCRRRRAKGKPKSMVPTFDSGLVDTNALGSDGQAALDGIKALDSVNDAWWGPDITADEALAILLFEEAGAYIADPSYLEAYTRMFYQNCGGGVWSSGCIQAFWGYYEAIRRANAYILKYRSNNLYSPILGVDYMTYARRILHPLNAAWRAGKDMERPYHSVLLTPGRNGGLYDTARASPVASKNEYKYGDRNFLALVLTPNELIDLCGNGTECSLVYVCRDTETFKCP